MMLHIKRSLATVIKILAIVIFLNVANLLLIKTWSILESHSHPSTGLQDFHRFFF